MKHRYHLVIAVVVITLMVGSFFAGRQFQSLAAASPSGRKSLVRLVSTMLTGGEAQAAGIQDVSTGPLDTFSEVLSHLRRDYVSSMGDERKLTYAAINGMLATLRDAPYQDRYTRFLEPGDYRAFLDENEGHFGGIGAEIGYREVKNSGTAKEERAEPKPGAAPAFHCPNCGAEVDPSKQYQIVVYSPLPDSPAEKAGLRAGDRILKIGDKPTTGLTLGEAVRSIKGRPGTVVSLEIERDGMAQPKQVQVTRSIISVKSVTAKMLPDKIGYISLTAFNDVTPKMMDDALKSLRAQGMRSLLLDLRNNPGGGLDVCIDVASDFIGEGPVVYIQERGRGREAREARKGSARFDLPLVVLVNSGSASASEILAGAIQDDKVGKILGVTTFGKGLVQTVFPLRDGSALTLTTARYLTAKMRDIDHKGIVPDIVVEQPKSDDPIPPLSDRDVQASAALKLLREGPGGGERPDVRASATKS